MSYVVRIAPFSEAKPSWYHNSFEPVLAIHRQMHTEKHDPLLHKLWEETYGYSIRFDKWGFVIGIDFPSEEDAILFMLRWS